ncbi:ABC transporter B family member [Arachis hypogaea]|nr:ABC transporter B family member [Arachis hypogaea]
MVEPVEDDGGGDGVDDLKKNVVRALPFFKLLSYADVIDWILMSLGMVGSIVHGMALPVGYLLLGKALNAFGNNIHDQDAMVKALKQIK